jgi:V8-like Glu-specific endopeptidase
MHQGRALRACLTTPRTGMAALAAVLACAAPAAAAPRLHAAAAPRSAARERAQAARVERYWTPARMRSARPLDLTANGGVVEAPPAPPTAAASFLAVATPEVPPYSVNGRIFVRQGKLRGYCSGTAIDSPTRALVLTAGHCVDSGPDEHGRSHWSSFLEFVPGFNGGVAPFGTFVARRGAVYAPRPWVKGGNPDFDMGAFLTDPNSEGANVADAVGGGVAIVTDLSRHQEFQTFGYPGETTHMQSCRAPYAGDNLQSYALPGPPILSILCRWIPGASGGAWLIGDGTQIDGMTTYVQRHGQHSYGPYFSAETIGKLVRGL